MDCPFLKEVFKDAFTMDQLEIVFQNFYNYQDGYVSEEPMYFYNVENHSREGMQYTFMVDVQVFGDIVTLECEDGINNGSQVRSYDVCRNGVAEELEDEEDIVYDALQRVVNTFERIVEMDGDTYRGMLRNFHYEANYIEDVQDYKLCTVTLQGTGAMDKYLKTFHIAILDNTTFKVLQSGDDHQLEL